MSTNLTKIPTKVTVGGLDVSSALDLAAPFTIERDAIGFVSVPVINATLTLLGGILGESINPKINPTRWLPGTDVEIQIDVGSGWQDPIFGGSLKIKNANQYDDGLPQFGGGPATIDRLTIELTCVLGFGEDQAPPQQPYVTTFNFPITLSEGIQQTLSRKDINFLGGATPSRDLRTVVQKTDQISSLPLFAHKLLWCTPTSAKVTYGLYSNNSGSASTFVLDLNAAPLLSMPAEALPSPPKFGQLGETEQLVGLIKAEGLITIFGFTSDPVEPPIEHFENGRLVYREIRETRLPNLVSNRHTSRTRKWQLRSEIVEGGGDDLIQSVDSSEETTYSFGRPSLIRSVTLLPTSVVTSDSSASDSLVTAEITEEYPQFGFGGRVSGREIRYYKAWGLLGKIYGVSAPSGSSATTVALERIESDRWVDLGNDQFRHVPNVYHAIAPAQFSTNQSRSGNAYGPPNYGEQPRSWFTKQVKIFAEVNLSVSGQLLSRERVLDFSNFPANTKALREIAEIEGALLTGRHYGHQIELNIRDLPGGQSPGYILRVGRVGDPSTQDDYLVSGEEISFHENLNGKPFSIYRAVGLHLRTNAGGGGTVEPIVTATPDNWVWQSGDNLVFQSSDNQIWHE